jgi:hypothetical protein
MGEWANCWACGRAAILLLALNGCTHAILNGHRVELNQADQLYTNVQELRQLNFKNQVPIVVERRAGTAAALNRELAHRFGPQGLRRNAEAGVLTGLYAPGTDLDAQIMRAGNPRLAGFYDHREARLILFARAHRSGWWAGIRRLFAHEDVSDDKMLFAHELTRALQDQYFGVNSRLQRLADNDDRALALNAVAEGDSALVGYGYADGLINNETARKFPAHAKEVPRLFDLESPDLARAARDPLMFSYMDGPRFVADVYRHGGWEGVNALYSDPALSTRQVLEPALYFSHPTPSPPIKLAGWARVLSGWREIAEDTYGEVLIRTVLVGHLDRNTAGSLAHGWRSDRMVVLQNSGATSVIWAILMNSHAQAAAFARNYEGVLRQTAPADHYVESRGSALLAIIGPAAVQSAELAPAVWRESRIGAATE